jgi:rubredoxin
MKTFMCSVCGLIFAGDEPPAQCPQCKAVTENAPIADEHWIGVAKGLDA